MGYALVTVDAGLLASEEIALVRDGLLGVSFSGRRGNRGVKKVAAVETALLGTHGADHSNFLIAAGIRSHERLLAV
jgi:hypothetical protein